MQLSRNGSFPYRVNVQEWSSSEANTEGYYCFAMDERSDTGILNKDEDLKDEIDSQPLHKHRKYQTCTATCSVYHPPVSDFCVTSYNRNFLSWLMDPSILKGVLIAGLQPLTAGFNCFRSANEVSFKSCALQEEYKRESSCFEQTL